MDKDEEDVVTTMLTVAATLLLSTTSACIAPAIVGHILGMETRRRPSKTDTGIE